ncbi:hypothetical protein, partial [Klebsiella pneumoniae]|uniref:hypothetical protein n=1 Tax=Klebsiella pneumoniae TaxID=573 RepID=UPI001C12F34F
MHLSIPAFPRMPATCKEKGTFSQGSPSLEDFPLKNTSIYHAREGANKQVISSQADSLIKISRIWADFFPA